MRLTFSDIKMPTGIGRQPFRVDLLSKSEYFLYDTRVAMRRNQEPLRTKYPHLSGYSAFGSNPIMFSDLDGNFITIRHNNSQKEFNNIVSYLEKMNATQLGMKLINIAKNSRNELSIGYGKISRDGTYGFTLQAISRNKDNEIMGLESYIQIDKEKHKVDGELDEYELLNTLGNEFSSVEDFFTAKDPSLYLADAKEQAKLGYGYDLYEAKSFEVGDKVEEQYRRLVNHKGILSKPISGLSGIKVEDKKFEMIPNKDEAE